MKVKSLLIYIMLFFIIPVVHYIPVICSDKFGFLTILSILPMYIISRKSPSLGLLSYISVFLLITLVSKYEGTRFLFINGLLGIFLGMLSHYLNKKILISLLMGIILYISINGMINTNNFSLLGSVYLNKVIFQYAIILFSLVFSFSTLMICDYLYRKIYYDENI